MPGTVPAETAHCRDRRYHLRVADSLQIYQVSLATGAVKYLGSKLGASATRVILPEDGGELLLSGVETPNGQTSSEITVGDGSIVLTTDSISFSCVVTSIPITSTPSGLALGPWNELARDAGRGAGAGLCPFRGSSMGSPTFAPDRIPNPAPMRIVPNARAQRAIRAMRVH